MSNHIHVFVTCDKCGTQTDGIGDSSIREARSQAKALEWKLGKSKDFCPSCSKEIAAAVKAAQAGNV